MWAYAPGGAVERLRFREVPVKTRGHSDDTKGELAGGKQGWGGQGHKFPSRCARNCVERMNDFLLVLAGTLGGAAAVMVWQGRRRNAPEVEAVPERVVAPAPTADAAATAVVAKPRAGGAHWPAVG